MITLVSGNQTLKVSEAQAFAILKVQSMMKATTWELPSQYQLTDNGIITKADTKADTGPATKKRAGTRNVASK
jgi:hypothetical protein